MSRFHSPLASQIARFIAHKRSLGYTYASGEYLLRNLDRLAASSGQSVIDESFARRFVSGDGHGCRQTRLAVLRPFSRFLIAEEPRTFVPPRRFLGVRKPPPVFRVLSPTEARRFYDACGELSNLVDPVRYRSWSESLYRSLVHGTALRMLLLTGLRRSEIVRLTVRDVDLTAGVLTIRESKFGKSRFVPLARDFTKSLRRYDAAMAERLPRRHSNDPFFPGRDGRKPCKSPNLYLSFRRTLEIAGIAHRGRGAGPRLHDLRHTFAVLRLLRWYKSGADLSAKLPYLATYLGHVGLSSTQVYLHTTPEIAGEVLRRYEARFGRLIREDA